MAQSTWLTDVADVVGGYYGRVQPKYNAARNRDIAAAQMSKANGALEALFASEFPDANLGGQDNFKAREALLSGIPRGSLNAGPEPANPMFSQLPSIQAPEPVKASAPMLTIPNQMYAHEAADVARELMPNRPGSAEYKQSGSSSGATAAQSDESYDEYRKTANELASKSKSLAINKARLEYMKQMAPAVKTKMFGTEEADAFDREVEKLNKDVEGDEAAQAKALTKKAELDQKIATSRKQAELQQAKITVAREAKSLTDEWRKEKAKGDMSRDRLKLWLDHLNKTLDRNVKVEGQMVTMATQGLPILAATGNMSKAVELVTRGQSLSRALNTEGFGTGAAAFGDVAQANKAAEELFKDLEAAATEQSYVAQPKEPDPGVFQSLFGNGSGASPEASASAKFTTPSLSVLSGQPFGMSFGGGGGSFETSSESGTVPAPTATKADKPKKTSKLKPDTGPKKATSPKVGDKNAEGKTWTGKRWL
jgi:hypothetical protein